MKKMLLSFFVFCSVISVNAQTDSLQQYTGKYKFPDGSPVTEITVSLDNGMLMASSAMGTTELKLTTTVDVFEIAAYGGTATFRRKEGKISGVQVTVGDINMEGEKTEGLAYNFSSVTALYPRKQN